MAEIDQGKLWTAGEVAEELRRSSSSVKRLADELRLDVSRTGNGTRLFRTEHVEKMRDEIVRRAREAVRR